MQSWKAKVSTQSVEGEGAGNGPIPVWDPNPTLIQTVLMWALLWSWLPQNKQGPGNFLPSTSMEIVFKHIWKPLVSLKTGRAVENGRQLISLQFGKSIGGQRGGPSVHTHRRMRWSCQCCPCWAHPTAAGQLLLLLLPLKYVEHQRGSGTSNRNSEKTQFVFFSPPAIHRTHFSNSCHD